MFPSLTDEELSLYVYNIRDVEQDKKTCSSCRGFPCSIRSEGRIPELVVRGNGLDTVYSYCPYERQKRGLLAYSTKVKSASIPEAYAEATWQSYEKRNGNIEAIKHITELLDGTPLPRGKTGLLFHGVSRCGKTMLASIYANERVKRGEGVLFIDVPSLLNDIKASYSKNDGKDQEIIKATRETPMLILDDLGAERMNSWVYQQLFLIVNHRINAGLPMIVTSNYDLGSLMEHLSPLNEATKMRDAMAGERLAKRIYEVCYPVKMW